MNKLYEICQRLQTIAYAGLTYSENKFDLERYEELRKISNELFSVITDEPIEKIENIFRDEKGYITPKVDIRGVVFRERKILMVKEFVDEKWTIPGGWADIGYSPKEIVIKEIKEESGLDVLPVKLLALLDKQRHPHPPSPFYTYKVFIQCKEIGGKLLPGTETLDANFFPENELPELSLTRITGNQLKMLFEFYDNPDKEVLFD